MLPWTRVDTPIGVLQGMYESLLKIESSRHERACISI